MYGIKNTRFRKLCYKRKLCFEKKKHEKIHNKKRMHSYPLLCNYSSLTQPVQAVVANVYKILLHKTSNNIIRRN